MAAGRLALNEQLTDLVEWRIVVGIDNSWCSVVPADTTIQQVLNTSTTCSTFHLKQTILCQEHASTCTVKHCEGVATCFPKITLNIFEVCMHAHCSPHATVTHKRTHTHTHQWRIQTGRKKGAMT